MIGKKTIKISINGIQELMNCVENQSEDYKNLDEALKELMYHYNILSKRDLVGAM